jgi:hypothetical protein
VLSVNVWVWLRVVAILLVAIGACITPLEPRFKPPLDWLTLLGIFVFIPVALVLVVGFQRLNPRSAKVWHRPSWSTNPFNFRDPIQFFYLGAFLSIAQGIVALLRVLVTSVPLCPEAFVPLTMGTGIWLGVKMVVFLNPAKFNQSTSESQGGVR